MQEIYKEDIRLALQQNRPGITAHKTMLPKGRSIIIPDSKKNIKISAVLVAVFELNNLLHFCLTKRSSKMKNHPGQISFPGGYCEKNDSSVYETALREMEEETGISKNSIETIGTLSEIYIPVSNFLIFPVVGFLNEANKFQINTHEVEEVITLPVNDFLKRKYEVSETINTTHGIAKVPCYKINGHIIWGATAMIIAEFSWMLKQHLALREGYSGNAENGQ